MIRRSAGNAGKSTVRCPRCTWENLRPRCAPWETLVQLDCHQCGFPIVVRLDIRDRWHREREEASA